MNIGKRAAVYPDVPIPVIAMSLVLLDAAPPRTPPPATPSLVVLADTGERRDDLPVVIAHPSPQPYLTELTRGFSGRLLRLYPMVQRFARPGRAPQPAYLVLSGNRGGFPRLGFHLEGRRLSDAAYVDLHRTSTLSGRFGAMDQIYPHELLHLMVSALIGPPPGGRDNQVHALGVRTDRATAFSEGFAEHAQVMAVEADGAAHGTRRLPADVSIGRLVDAQLAAYGRALTARWAIAPRAVIGFPLWFGANEQVLRYRAVRENLFAREATIPAELLRGDLYRAYLLENILPGTPDAPPKSAARMVATEGVVSTLFYRLATSSALRERFRPSEFYARFGVEPDAVDPIDNVYLKLFAAIREGGYDTVAVLRAYVRLFPEDADAVGAILDATLLGQPLPASPAIWLRNPGFLTGTSLFDQFRGLPRAHTFDLNAASIVDLIGVPGVSEETARAIQRAAPFERLDALRRVDSVDDAVFARFEGMARAYLAAEERPPMSVRAILLPYLRRAIVLIVACAVVSAAAYRAVRRARWWRAAIDGLAVAIVGLAAGWVIEGPAAVPVAAPLILCGLPAALFALWRTRAPRRAGMVLAAWALASVIPGFIVWPIA
jgi:hypothetical protein